MATLKTVTGKVTGPDGSPVPRAVITVTNSQPTTIPGSQEIAQPTTPVIAGPDGSFSLSLYSNNDLTPNGTAYTVQAVGSIGQMPVTITWTIQVPQTAGPFEISNILTTTPTLQATPTHVSTLTVDGSATFTAGPVVIGADPGGGQLLRVGGTGHFSGLLTGDVGASFAAGNFTVSAGGQVAIIGGVTLYGNIIEQNSGQGLDSTGVLGLGVTSATAITLGRSAAPVTIPGGLTVTAGGLTVTAGGITVSAGALTVNAGTFIATGTGHSLRVSDAGTNTMVTIAQAWHSTSAVPVAGFGAEIAFVLTDAGANSIQTGGLRSTWVNPAVATRSANTQIIAGLNNAEVLVATFANDASTTLAGALTVSSGGLTVSAGDVLISAGSVVLQASAVDRVRVETAWSGTNPLHGNIFFNNQFSKIFRIGASNGADSLYVQSQTNNQQIMRFDGTGLVTAYNGLTVTAGGLTVSAGGATITGASQIGTANETIQVGSTNSGSTPTLAIGSSVAGIATLKVADGLFTKAAGGAFSMNSGVSLAGNIGLTLNSPAGTNRIVWYQTSGSSRWSSYADGGAESGGNVGSDFHISRYTDAGVFVDDPILIRRSTGLVTIADGLTVSAGGLVVTGGSQFNTGLTVTGGIITSASGISITAAAAGNPALTANHAAAATVPFLSLGANVLTATTATAGANGAPPAQVKAYLPVTMPDGTTGKIPVYAN